MKVLISGTKIVECPQECKEIGYDSDLISRAIRASGFKVDEILHSNRYEGIDGRAVNYARSLGIECKYNSYAFPFVSNRTTEIDQQMVNLADAAIIFIGKDTGQDRADILDMVRQIQDKGIPLYMDYHLS